MADVFLSYARPDARLAERVQRELSKLGYSVWFDREIPAHRPYSDVITTELESAAAVLVLWSKASITSEWVRSEANRARELRKLVQARIDDVRLPMPFDQIQCADLLRWRGGSDNTGWKQLSNSIQALSRSTSAALPSKRTSISRRATLLGGGAVALAGAGTAGSWLWLHRQQSDQPSPEAALLLQKGIDTLQSDDVFEADNPGSLRDAIALLTEATEADPRSSEAWGALSLAYAALKRVSAPPERPGLELRSRSAASRAFQLEPREPRATGALLLLEPLYRRWLQAEHADSSAMKNTRKRVPLLLFVMADMLRSVGRCKEAASVSSKFDRRAFIIPGADEQVLLDLWCAGDLQAADQAMALSVQHWPQHPQVWRTRVAYLMYSGRAPEALTLVRDDSSRPPGIPSEFVELLNATASALTGRGDASAAVRSNVEYVRKNPSAAIGIIHACAALGDGDSAFSILGGYFFNEAPWSSVAPRGGDEDRATGFLFQPPMKGLWTDARFATLLRRTGLEDYWRRSGTHPDFPSAGFSG